MTSFTPIHVYKDFKFLIVLECAVYSAVSGLTNTCTITTNVQTTDFYFNGVMQFIQNGTKTYELLLHNFIRCKVTCIYTVIPVSVLTSVNGTATDV